MKRKRCASDLLPSYDDLDVLSSMKSVIYNMAVVKHAVADVLQQEQDMSRNPAVWTQDEIQNLMGPLSTIISRTASSISALEPVKNSIVAMKRKISKYASH